MKGAVCGLRALRTALAMHRQLFPCICCTKQEEESKEKGRKKEEEKSNKEEMNCKECNRLGERMRRQERGGN